MSKARILIAENDALVALDLASEIAEVGFEVAGMAHSFARLAHKVERIPFDVALIAVRLGDEFTYPVARKLAATGRPFAFVTAYAEHELPPDLRDVPRIEKPFLSREVADIARRLSDTSYPTGPNAA